MTQISRSDKVTALIESYREQQYSLTQLLQSENIGYHYDMKVVGQNMDNMGFTTNQDVVNQLSLNAVQNTYCLDACKNDDNCNAATYNQSTFTCTAVGGSYKLESDPSAVTLVNKSTVFDTDMSTITQKRQDLINTTNEINRMIKEGYVLSQQQYDALVNTSLPSDAGFVINVTHDQRTRLEQLRQKRRDLEAEYSISNDYLGKTNIVFKLWTLFFFVLLFFYLHFSKNPIVKGISFASLLICIIVLMSFIKLYSYYGFLLFFAIIIISGVLYLFFMENYALSFILFIGVIFVFMILFR